ncbi:protein phosphatase 2C [Trypanosoma rangeli]|uniref:Protein phosphatase 2C n=1 Tax=Trypanosoma rangeli TaxID=5698 RepID=A0A422NTV6_TRYRA|nr:protein phosphatase 2C [Trypanosoma rangeli]RNF08896.1 protein phosphatase 2C [Trypanosoma rangeli]|eukprot:RNF08896.1 protein phosphatase 2C [Trypanosoma rangeli]
MRAEKVRWLVGSLKKMCCGIARQPTVGVEQCERKYEVRHGAAAPLSMQGEAKTIASNNTGNERGAVPPTSPFCLDVLVSSAGDSHAFGIARNTFSSGFHDPWDATREPVVSLS